MNEPEKTTRTEVSEGMDALADVVDAFGQFGDLGPRAASAAVMLVVGGFSIAMGEVVFVLFEAIVTALMIWELARICKSHWSFAALIAAYSGFIIVGLDQKPLMEFAFFALPVPLALAVVAKRLRPHVTIFSVAILLAGVGLSTLRWQENGLVAMLWLIGVVVTSDIAGYFVGRIVGGPKFLPAISPKKTWSGTAAGWIGAAVLGAGFYAAGYGSAALIVISPLIAFAGQMGDIAESWLKRRAEVKDASHLIPGHGGLMDRFDALVGATLVIMALQALAPTLFAQAFGV